MQIYIITQWIERLYDKMQIHATHFIHLCFESLESLGSVEGLEGLGGLEEREFVFIGISHLNSPGFPLCRGFVAEKTVLQKHKCNNWVKLLPGFYCLNH